MSDDLDRIELEEEARERARLRVHGDYGDYWWWMLAIFGGLFVLAQLTTCLWSIFQR